MKEETCIKWDLNLQETQQEMEREPILIGNEIN